MSPPGGNGTKATLTDPDLVELGIPGRLRLVERDIAAIIAGERRCAADVAARLEEMAGGWSSDLGDLRDRFVEMSSKLDKVSDAIAVLLSRSGCAT